MPRASLLILLLAAIAGGALWGLWTTPTGPKQQPEPTIAIGGPTLTRFDEGGQRWWELEAGAITLDEESGETLAEDVRLRFFRGDEVALEVTAARLLLFNRSEEMELEGGIMARNDQGVKFFTERMRWDPERAVLVGKGKLEVAKGESRLTGKGFEYSPKENRLEVKEGAHLILLPEE